MQKRKMRPRTTAHDLSEGRNDADSFSRSSESPCFIVKLFHYAMHRAETNAKLLVAGVRKKLKKTTKYKSLMISVTAYVILSALCNVVQMRMYKQLLIYSYVHEIIVATAVQCSLLIPLLFVWGCGVRAYKFYANNVSRKPRAGATIQGEEGSFGFYDGGAKMKVSRRHEKEMVGSEKKRTQKRHHHHHHHHHHHRIRHCESAEIRSKDRYTSSSIRFYFTVSFLSFVSGALKVLPIVVLPSMFVVMVDQFGLAFMMLVSVWYLGRKYDKVQILCIVLIALGLIVEMIPDYEESLTYAKDMSHDFFWRSTVYHDYNASTNHFYRNHKGSVFAVDEYDYARGKSTLLFREKFVNASLFDLSRCLKYNNVSIVADEAYSYSFYKKALENETLKWWKDNNVAFVVCAFLAVSSSLPECMSYAIMEKFWKINERRSASEKEEGEEEKEEEEEEKEEDCTIDEVGGGGGKEKDEENLSMGSFEISAKIVAFKLIWVMLAWPFFYLDNQKWGGYHYLKYGSQCSFDNLYYDAYGINYSDENDGNVNNGTAGSKITFVRLDGDGTNEELDAKYKSPSYSEGNNNNIVSAYWECSPWRNGITCENMLYLTLIYCAVDFAQYVLHVKIIKDTTNANLAWLLGIVRIGISDAMFSIPVIAGAVFSDFRYFDVLSLLIVVCSTFIFWLHKYQDPYEEDDDEDEDDEDDDGNYKRMEDERTENHKTRMECVQYMYDSDEPFLPPTNSRVSSGTIKKQNDSNDAVIGRKSGNVSIVMIEGEYYERTGRPQ